MKTKVKHKPAEIMNVEVHTNRLIHSKDGKRTRQDSRSGICAG